MSWDLDTSVMSRYGVYFVPSSYFEFLRLSLTSEHVAEQRRIEKERNWERSNRGEGGEGPQVHWYCGRLVFKTEFKALKTWDPKYITKLKCVCHDGRMINVCLCVWCILEFGALVEGNGH